MRLTAFLLSLLALDALPLFASISFTNQASTAGVANPSSSNGGAFGDYDGDGWPDLLVVSLESNGAVALYRNQGNGRFADHSEALASTGRAPSGVFVDYDGDGDLDIYIVYFSRPNQLLRNDEGRFTPVPLPDTLQEEGGAVSVAFGDFDGDGKVDLFTSYRFDVANRFYSRFYTPGFADQSRLISSLRSGWESFGAVPFDYDNDGDLDLYITTVGSFNLLHRNDGNGVFRQVGEALEVDQLGSSVGAFAADYDNDGDLDLYMVNLENEDNVLYRNDGGEGFVNVAAMAGLEEGHSSLGAAWADFDNDGDLDLVVSNAGQPHVFTNNGNGTFENISEIAVQDDNLSDGMITAGVAVADYDLDGDIDIFLGGLNVPDLLLRNDTADQGHWLRVRLQARGSEQTALGARVTVKTPDGAQMREYIIAATLGSLHGDLLHFGLGVHEEVEELVVEWPSGQRQILQRVAADQVITVKELLPADDLRISSVVRPDLSPGWEPLIPEVEVYNAGQTRVQDAVLQAQITYKDRSVYRVSLPVPELAVGAAVQIRFPSWMPEESGAHRFSFSLEGNDDANNNNTWERVYHLYPFEDVAAELGVDDEGIGWAGAFADYDNDGDLDIYLSNGGPLGGGANVFYRNDVERGFVDVTTVSGVDDDGNGTGLTFADFDQDGFQDLFIAKGGFTVSGEPNRLFHNNGDGTFSDISRVAGLDIQQSSYATAVGDYDQDGHLDLYISQLLGQSNTLYHNEGDGTFVDASADKNILSLSNIGGSSAAFADFDDDGDVDLYASLFGGADIFYAADGDDNSRFSASMIGDQGEAMGMALGDYDNNGSLDIYVVNLKRAQRALSQ